MLAKGSSLLGPPIRVNAPAAGTTAETLGIAIGLFRLISEAALPAAADLDNFGEDRERDLLRRDGAEIEPAGARSASKRSGATPSTTSLARRAAIFRRLPTKAT